MEAVNEIWIGAPAERVFELAAEVERWPELLPHYRWVRVLEHAQQRKVVEMAARRDWIPVRWRAVQQLFPSEGRITFQHIGGVTRGMEVEWRLTADSGGVQVRIWHQFRPAWPLVPDALIELVIGRFFVASIAGRTLRHIKAAAEGGVSGGESQASGPVPGRESQVSGPVPGRESQVSGPVPGRESQVSGFKRPETRDQRPETGDQEPETGPS